MQRSDWKSSNVLMKVCKDNTLGKRVEEINES
jgi:hypothetical protein